KENRRAVDRAAIGSRRSGQAPTASATHFFMWLALAAPASFFSLESASHLALASDSHFFMWLVSAAPASFLSAESLLQVANALVVASESTAARMRVFISVSSDFCRCRERDRPLAGRSILRCSVVKKR